MIIIILTGGLRRRQIVTTQPTQRMKGNRVISTPLKIMKIMADVSSLGSNETCLLYTSPSPRDKRQSRMPSSA